MENFSFNLLFSFTKSTLFMGNMGQSIKQAALIEYNFLEVSFEVLLLQNSFIKFGNEIKKFVRDNPWRKPKKSFEL